MSKQTFTTGQILTAAQMTTLQANDYNQTVNAKVASYTLVATDAGTRITMNNASATTITVNTSVFAAGDTLTITNIGAGVCTITAGTATVSTAGSLALAQYDSGTLYFTSTGVSIWNGANPGDITGVTAGTGISGGGTSGTVTITNSMATEITAAGDIIVGTGSGTFDNLPIGTTGQVLTADTTVSPYKVKWASTGASSFVGSSCTITTNFPVSTATWTQVTWANELYDAGNIHAASSGEFVTNATGYWLVTGNVMWDTGAGGFGQIYINNKRGSTNYQIYGSTRMDSTSYISLGFSGVVTCISGDILSLYAYQNSGVTRSLQGGGEPKSYISVSYLGA
jgi:hypothetical protein